jgi:hypothetical protein
MQATIRQRPVNSVLYRSTTMERTTPADRSNLIRVSVFLFSILAVASFVLARVA